MKTYSVKSIFDTIQGEGMRAGTRAVFIRFSGCNMWNGLESGRDGGLGACAKWCDTDFKKEGSKKMTSVEIVDKVVSLMSDWVGKRWVVVTGGEPFLQFDRELAQALRRADISVAVETNGTVAPTMLVDWLCVSPKLLADGSLPNIVVGGADELKIVLGASNADWNDKQLLEISLAGSWLNLIVQPVDATVISKSESKSSLPLVTDSSIARCIDWVKRNPNWKLGYQLHKVLNVP